uniref:Uncharacterized protein n=1 Tax=Oryzias latipes TaxID=8090 RepID=A0A3B3HX93_ORYLA
PVRGSERRGRSQREGLGRRPKHGRLRGGALHRHGYRGTPAGCGQVSSDCFRCGQVSSDCFRCGQVSSDCFRCGQVSSDCFRCGQVPDAHVTTALCCKTLAATPLCGSLWNISKKNSRGERNSPVAG